MQHSLGRHLYLLAFLTCCLIPYACASTTELHSTTNHVISEINRIDIAASFEMLEDESGDLSVADVIASPDLFRNSKKTETLSFGFTQSTIWIKTSINYTKPSLNHEQWILEISMPTVKELELYKVAHEPNGDIISYKKLEPINSRNHLFPLQFSSDANTSILFKINTVGALEAEAELIPVNEYNEKRSVIENAFGVIFGIMIAMVIYNSSLYFIYKNVNHLWYVSFILFASLCIASLTNYGNTYLWNAIPTFNLYAGQFFGQLSILSLLVFVYLFIDIESVSPKLNKVVFYSCIASCFVTLFTALSLDLSILIAQNVFTIYSAPLILYTSIYCWRHGSRSAGFISSAFTVAVIGAVLSGLKSFGLLPSTTHGIFYIGLCFTVMLLSLALADQIKQARQQKQRKQKEMNRLQIKAIEDHELQQNALQASADQYKRLYEESLDGLFQIDNRLHIISANHTMANLLGFESVPTLDKNFLWFIIDLYKSNNKLFDIVEELKTKQQVDNAEIELQLAENAPTWLSLSIKRITDSSGNEFIEGSAKDITQRKLNQRALVAREAATVNAVRKSAFLNNMSHIIRAPLTSIVGFSEILLDKNIDTYEREEASQIILQSSRQLLTTINDILELSKIEAKKIELETRAFELPLFFKTLCDTYEKKAIDKGLDFNISIIFPIPKMITNDVARLEKVLQQLIGNAIKYTDEGSVSVVLSCDKQYHVLKINVQDTGIGIGENKQAYLFDAFSTRKSSIDNSDNQQTNINSGLGLPIASHLATLMGGLLSVESSLGKGSTFSLNLPVQQSDTANYIYSEKEWDENLTNHMIPKKKQITIDDSSNDSLPEDFNQQLIAAKGNQKQLRVLVAEDTIDIQTIVELYLSRQGALTHTANNGEEAIQLYHTIKPDIILMDIHMPIKDGVTTLKELRAMGATLPIYALTADDDPQLIKRYLSMGFDGHLAKPINKVALTDLLSQIENGPASLH